MKLCQASCRSLKGFDKSRMMMAMMIMIARMNVRSDDDDDVMMILAIKDCRCSEILAGHPLSGSLV